jgi:enolase
MRPDQIASVHARQILDSRGRPTVEAEVVLADGATGRACVPSGASTGRHEAHELRDGDPSSFQGRGVQRAVAAVRERIAPTLRHRSALDQEGCDAVMRELDGSPQLTRLGGNAVLAVSLAVCRAAAAHRGVPLYAHIAELADSTPSMPVPMTNILSGGAHASRSMDIQDFLVIPVGAGSYSQALEMITRVRAEAARLMAERGLTVLLADEGGLSPGFADPREALSLMLDSFGAAGLRAGEDAAIALDVAASELNSGGGYQLAHLGRRLSPREMAGYVGDLVASHPAIVSVEDPLDQDDWETWRELTTALPGIQVVGDDLFATNPGRIARGITAGAANAVLIKPNQNGTLSGTLAAMAIARRAGYSLIVSARSGETEDSFVADLAVGTGAGQIKIGSVRSSERLAKYNQLLRIEESLGDRFDRRPALAGRFSSLGRDASQQTEHGAHLTDPENH